MTSKKALFSFTLSTAGVAEQPTEGKVVNISDYEMAISDH